MKQKTEAKVLRATCLAPAVYELVLETPLAEEAKPGCFVGVYSKDKSRILPRPISICEADKEAGTLRFVYRIAGQGTQEFSELKEGDSVDILGILGNGYNLSVADGKKAVLLGGGIGIPPMLQLAKELIARGQADVTSVMGYRDNNTFLLDDFRNVAEAGAAKGGPHLYGVETASEDGSQGTKGNVLDALREKEIEADILFACGPMPMLRAIKKFAEENEIPAYISLEERMACGIGACLGCVCKTTKEDHHSHVNNARICTEGPVFLAEDVEI